jgi:DNA primase
MAGRKIHALAGTASLMIRWNKDSSLFQRAGASSHGLSRMGLIPEETIQQVIAASDIVGIISGHFPLKRVGSNFKALCPFHSERTPSFIVNPARNSFHCFGCHVGGGPVKFVELYEHVSFPEAVRRLAERAGIAIVEVADDAESAAANRQRKELLVLHREAAEWFHQLLLNDAMAGPARGYWKRRGLSGDHARRWKIGYAPPGADTIRGWAKERGISERLLIEGGLISCGDDAGQPGQAWFRFGGRLVFPIHNEHGEVVAFSGRILDKDDQAAKYLNSPETPIFSKGRTFFGLDKSRRAIARAQRAIICEGQLDLITCFENGVENVVAPLGTALTDHHARMIRRLADEAILCFDSDTAGYKASGRAFRELARAGVFVRVVQLPDGEDPDSLIRSQGADAFRASLHQAVTFFDYQIGHLNRTADLTTARDRLRAVDELAPGIASLTEKTAQEDAIYQASTRLAVPTEDIRRRVSRAAREIARERRWDAAAPGPAVEEPLVIASNAVRLLCKLALTDAAAREWLLATGDSAWLDDLGETELLSRLWRSPKIDPLQPTTVAAMIATLNDREQAFLSALLADNQPTRGLDDARAAFFQLKLQRLKGLIDQKQARLRLTNLPHDDIVKLTREVIDLNREIRELRALELLPASLVPF